MLDGVDLAVPEATIFSLLGPNGAGKTTTVKILSTLHLRRRRPGDSASAGTTSPSDPTGVRAAIGVTGQFAAVDGLLTGEENMLLMGDLHHLSKRDGRLRPPLTSWSTFDLSAAADQPASDLLRRDASAASTSP